MKNKITIRKQEQHGQVTWTCEVVENAPFTVGQPRFEVRGAMARLVVEMPDYVARMLADELGGLPFYPAPLDATEQLGHAVRELANAASEMAEAARALQPPSVVVVPPTAVAEEGQPVGFCQNYQDHGQIGPHAQSSACSNWQYAYLGRR